MPNQLGHQLHVLVRAQTRRPVLPQYVYYLPWSQGTRCPSWGVAITAQMSPTARPDFKEAPLSLLTWNVC